MQPDELLTRLEGVITSGDGWVARCPAHDDRRQSLSVGVGADGRVLVNCHAGCAPDAICVALGITLADLFTVDQNGNGSGSKATQPRREIVATYDYVDEKGVLLYQVVRFDPKDFRQRRPDGEGGWTWKVAGTRRVLYRLPQVQFTAALGGTIYVVEGEKDVHAIEAAGAVATTSPAGAGKWRPEYSEALTGAQVVVVADKDLPGRQHAEQVAASLQGKARSVRILEAAAGKDAADHLAAGKTLEELVPPAWTRPDARPGALDYIDWASFWAAEHTDEDWLFQDVLALGRGHSVYAKHGLGKSLFTAFMCAKVATEGRAAVCYLDYEMTEADLFERLDAMGYGPKADLSRLRYALLPSLPPLDTTAGAEVLLKAIDELKAEYPGLPIVCVIDTISRAVEGDENDADTVRAFYRCTGIGLKQRGVTWMRLDHAGKDKDQGQRGSSGKGDDVDVVWRLEQTQNGIRLRREKARMGWVPETVTFGMFEGPLRYLPITTDWPAGTASLANLLDRLEVPLDASSRAAQKRLQEVDEGCRNEFIIAALKWRRERVAEGGKHPGNHREAPADPVQEQLPESPGSTADSGPEAPPEAPGSTDQRQGASPGPPLKGSPGAAGSDDSDYGADW